MSSHICLLKVASGYHFVSAQQEKDRSPPPKPIYRSASLHVEAFIPVFTGEPFVGFLVHLVSFALEATKPWASAH